MTDEELEALLDELEADLREDVQAALTLTAQDFAFAVQQSTELVAAAFSVRRIGNMWRRRVGGIMTRLRSIASRGARVTAEGLEEPVPTVAEMEPVLAPYLEATRDLLNEVGDRLSAEAVQTLAEGQAAGESLAQLKRRLITVFNDDGSQLGPTRAERIAATEATRAFNAGTLAAAEALTGPERPLIKQWITRNDEKVRQAHRDANGQLQFLSDPFDVGGTPMQYPGDPSAPADLTINCRCIMRAEAAPQPTEGTDMDEGDLSAAELQSKMPAQLKKYWLTGDGAARIGWGTPGSFERCVRELGDEFPQNTEGLCANLYHEATGRWPGQDKSGAEVHTGAMIALLPSAADAERLAVAGGEAADQLHMTLYYLGDAVDWDERSRLSVINAMRGASGWLAPLHANLFGVAHWNPHNDDPAWVWNVGDDRDADRFPRVLDVHHEVSYALEEFGQTDLIPQQHSPWSPHVCAQYGECDPAQLVERVGPVVFDRLRVAFGGEYTDFPLIPEDEADYEVELPLDEVVPTPEVADYEVPMVANWTTPGDTALAFENEQTGDGRVFAAGALYWNGPGPWPLQYADEMLGGHDGAQLAGAINRMERISNRLDADGPLYLTQSAGVEAAQLLAKGAPLGVSVDLDDVDIEMVDATPGAAETYRTKLLTASVLPQPDGGWLLVGETEPELSASSSGMGFMTESRRVSFAVGADGRVPGSLFDFSAAAGDTDVLDGVVVDQQHSGDYLMRITRARVRGATLVTIPAYANARIELDNPELFASAQDEVSAAAAVNDYDRVVRHVRKSLVPVDPAGAARFLGISIVAARRFLARAVQKGDLVRLVRGKYVAPADATSVAASAGAATDLGDTLVASVTGAVDLPVADRDTQWDGDDAKDRVFTWADGDVDRISRAFAYRDDEADPLTKGAYKLGYADVLDDQLVIVPAGVSAALGALNGARGGVDLPSGERNGVRARLEAVAAHVTEETGGDEMTDMHASAWAAMRDLPPMPAAWFAEPTAEELPPGGPGVNYSNGRIFGWVAQAGEPHAGFAKKITIDGLGRIDTTHFLRQRFELDDGTVVKAGAYTMNVGHHRDSAECETSACQFDNTRTVAGVVTVGMNERGMWFSGAASPWLSEWDRTVFKATQPSYHMKKGPGGNWQLRAVLGVPVPGHSSPLLASAVVERSQLALTAAASMVEVEEVVADVTARLAAEQAASVATIDVTAGLDYDKLAEAMVAAMARSASQEAELQALLAEAATIGGEDTGTEGD